MNKKILPLLLVAVLCLGTIAGCGSRKSSSDSKSRPSRSYVQSSVVNSSTSSATSETPSSSDGQTSSTNSSQSSALSSSKFSQTSIVESVSESKESSSQSQTGEVSVSVSNESSSKESDQSVSNSTSSLESGSSSISSTSSSEINSSSVSSTSSSERLTYAVHFNAGGGMGTLPASFEKYEGEVFALTEPDLTKEWCVFVGWNYNGTFYAVGEQFTMPSQNVTFTAVWKSTIAGQPLFSSSNYTYDRIGGGDLELPLNLDGATVYYVKVDGEYIDEKMFFYDYDTECLVIDEYFVLRLADGEHTIKPITDAGIYGSPECTLYTDNSIKTSIENNFATFNYGKQAEVTFGFDFNGTTVKNILLSKDVALPEQYYTVNTDTVDIDADYLAKFCKEASFDIVLTNNDVYNISVSSNVIFVTDYDVTTIHNTTQSNIGHNPLYQYYDNVSIVDAPDGFGMNGKVLKITPNTVDVTYDCHGYYTLKGPSCSYMWYDVGYTSGKYYSISFDYATENTSIGTFCFKTESGSWSQDLLLGAKNDGKVHHFSTVLSGEQIAYGTLLWAKFIGGGGNVYVDNFTVSELGAAPSISKIADYSSGIYEFNLNANGFLYDVLIDGVSYNVSVSGNKAAISSVIMDSLDYGEHTISVDFGVATLSFNFIKKSSGTVNLTQSTVNIAYGSEDVKIAGNITAGEKLISIKRAGNNFWDNTYDSDSGIDNYSEKNGYISTDYIKVVSDGIVLTKELIKKLYGTQTLTLTFSNGTQILLTVNSNTVFYSDWDEFYINEESVGNIRSCQDTAMRSFITTQNSGLAIKYSPENAVLSHSSYANTLDNGIMTFSNNKLNHWWWEMDFPTDGRVRIFFDYEAVTGTKESNYVFTAFVGTADNYSRVDTKLSGKGVFDKEFDSSTLVAFYIHCPYSAKSEIKGTYLIIDNFGFAASSGLAQTMATVSYGQQSVKLLGTFDSSLTVSSIKRRGTNYWDNTFDSDSAMDNFSESNGYMNASYITVQTDGLLISQELINQCYGTMAYEVTLSNGSVYNFTLTSNLLFYTDFDETYINEESVGNIESCQDTSMRSFTTTQGSGKTLLYTPANATISHAVGNGTLDNGIMTFSNNLRNHWWWEFDFPSNATVIIFFDYVVNVQPSDGIFKFTYMHGGTDGVTNYSRVSQDLTGSGRFYIEIQASDLNAFYIHCQSATFAGLSGASMTIDNFGFGIKA